MSTPRNPGPRLPDKPATPPSIVQEPTPSAAPSDPTSVLERLKAARPHATVTVADEAKPDGARTGTAPGALGARREPPAGRAGADTVPAAPVPATGPPVGGGDTAGGGDASDGGAAVGGGDAPGPAAGTHQHTPSRTDAGTTAPGPSHEGDAARRLRSAADRARVAADRARIAAAAGGRALGRGSSATVHRVGSDVGSRVGSWDRDVLRQSVVTVCALVCILGSAAGVGAFGGPSIREAADGLFAPDATLLAPSSSAFTIWSVIYAGLVAYTAFQWLPSQRRSERQRRLGWTVAASMLLNPAWIASAQGNHPTLSLVVIALLLLALLSAVRTLNSFPNQTRLEGALVDTPIGLYLGWVLLATAANTAAVLTAGGVELFGWEERTWAIVGIIAVLLTAAVICSTDRGRLSVAAATSWGLLWIAVERVLGRPYAVDIAFAAGLAVFLLLITAGSRRHRVDHAYRRWLRAQQDAQREPLDLLGDDYARS